MYKDVWKRIWAFVMMLCLVVTMVEWPTTVYAAQGTVNTYQNGNGALDSEPYAATTVAAVFTANRNADGAELLDSIDFYAHVEGGGQATATVAYSKDLTSAAPDSGTVVFQEVMSVAEGKNTYSAGLANQVMTNGSAFSVMITLQGASFYTYGGTETGQSYVLNNGWQDMYTSGGKCAAITAYTYNVTETAPRKSPSANTSAQNAAAAPNAQSSDPMYLNKSDMMMAVDWVDKDLTLLNATERVTWSSENASVAEVSGNGSTATVRGTGLGTTTINAMCDGQTFPCTITVTPKIEEDSITLAPEKSVYNGGQQVPAVSVEVGGYTLTYIEHYQIFYRRMNAGNIEDLFPANDQSFVDAGTYYVQIIGQNGYSSSAACQKTYMIEPKDVSDASIEVKLKDGINWDAVLTNNPDEATLKGYVDYVKDNGRVDGVTDLVLGTDYTLAVGQDGKSIILTGMGNYAGNRYCGAPRSLTEAVITFDKSGYVYTGKKWTPALQVTVDGVTLSQSDYDVVYPDDIDVTDKAKVTVTGKGGSFYGTKEAYFTIVPKDIGNADKEQVGMEVNVQAAAAGVTDPNDPSTAEPVITVTYNGMTLVEGTDYDIEPDVTPTEGGTYRRILRGKGNYKGTYTVEYSVGTALKKYIDSITVENATYDGTAKTPLYTINWVGGSNTAGLAEGVDYTVTYKNNINAGTGTVTLQGIGTYGGSISGTFTIGEADINNAVCNFLDENGKEVSTAGYQIEFSPDVADVKPGVVVKFPSGAGYVTLPESDYELTYSVDTTNAFGPQTVTITPKNNNFTTTTKSLTYNIKKCRLDSTKITATLNKEVFDYTGAEITPPDESLVYRSKSGATYKLTKGTDYTVTYSPSTIKEIGTYQVLITADPGGNYEGIVTMNFEVAAVDIQTLVNGNLTVTNSPDRKVSGYTGPYWAMLWYDNNKSNNMLEVEITDGKGYTLIQGTDYELTDWKNLNSVSREGATAAVTIKGKGKYYGSVEIKYLLAAPLNQEYTASIDNSAKLVYTGEPIELGADAVTVTNNGIGPWKEVLERDVDYTLSYKDPKDNTLTDAVNAGEATATVEEIPLKEQPTANGCYVYEDRATLLSGTFTISPKDIATEVSCEPLKFKYEGKPIEFTENDIHMTYRNQSLTWPDDFKIVPDSFTNNDKPTSLAYVVVQGNGNYTGTKVIVFTIMGKTLDDIVSWKVDATKTTYTGERLYPAITEITMADGKTLTESTTPKISDIIAYDESSYANNLDAGMASITVSGKGEYAETADRVLEFAILPRSLDNTNCTVSGISTAGYTYTSQEITPTVTVQCVDLRKQLTSDDYDISYEKNVDAGEASITIDGKGNYTGTHTETFEILPKSLDTGVTIAPIASQNYDGIAVTPAPVVNYDFGDGIYTLSPENDYTVAYRNNQGPGTAKVIVTAKQGGNFTGSIEAEFRIGQSITEAGEFEISCPDLENGTVFTYTGEAFTPEVTVTRIQGGTTRKLEEGKDYEVTYGENIHAGKGTITVEGIGIYTGTWERSFTIAPRDLSDSAIVLAVEGVTDGSYVAAYTGSPVEPKVTVTFNGKPVEASNYTISYGANNTNRGIITLRITANGGTDFTGTRSTTFEIGVASIGNGGYVPANGFRIGAIEAQPLVDGAATPQPKLYYNGAALVYGRDYVCTYENNDRTGTNAVVILTGIGNYTGSVRKTFEICGNIADADITVPDEVWFRDYAPSVNPDGSFDEVEITFDDQVEVALDGTVLEKNKDYTLTYANNTWVGNASVIIKGKGSLAGSVEKIVPIKASFDEKDAIEVTVGDQKYTGNPVEAVPIITYYGTALTAGKHFIVVGYENNVAIGKDTASVELIGNENNGFSGTLTANFSIVSAPGTLTVSGVESSYKYRGVPIRPQITVKVGNRVLSASDYGVTYGPNTNAGTDAGSVYVVGKNSYAGMYEVVSFDIEPQRMADLKVMDGNQTTMKSREYTGKEILPEITLNATIGTSDFAMPESGYTIAKKNGSDNVNVGTGTIVVTGDGTNIIGSKEVTFRITPKSLAKPTGSAADTISVEVVPDSFAYDGTEKRPTVIVTYQYGTESETRQLTEGVDFTVGYSNNVNAGTAKATVTGQGNYTNSRTVEFTITEKDFSGAVVSLPNGDTYTYMGSNAAIEPAVTVTLDGMTLTAGTDYKVEYQNNRAVGTANVIVTGMGSYAGSVTKAFTIESHDIAAADVTVAPIPNQAYTGQPVIPEVNVTCGDYKLQQGVDFTLTFDTDNTQIGTVLMRINGTGGFTNYRQASFAIASDIAQAEVSGIKDSYPYMGAVYTEADLGTIEVRIGKTVLSPESYSFAFKAGSDGKSAGEQTLLLVGEGSYGGRKEIPITITPKDISEADVVMAGFKDSVPYSDNITQDVTFTWGAIPLVKNLDYTVTCRPSGTAGAYEMEAKGSGNYTGTVVRAFTVEQTAIDGIEVKGISSTYTYTGQAIEPEFTVWADGKQLEEADYTVSYENNVDAGVAKVTITGTGLHYYGTKEVTFNILRKSVHLCNIGAIPTQVYTGADIKPVVTVADGGTALVELEDYTLMYANNRKAGTGVAAVAGKGNYTATKNLTFDIRPCSVGSVAVTGRSNSTVSLSWKSEGVVTGYEVYRAGADGKWKQVTRTRGTSCTDQKLKANTTYSYKVRSYLVADGETYYGAFSAVVTGTTSK